MNNVDNVVICVNQGVNKCNLHLILEHPDPGLNLPVYCFSFARRLSEFITQDETKKRIYLSAYKAFFTK